MSASASLSKEEINKEENNNNNNNDNILKLPPPAELGIIPENYAYCYCEENVRRAIVKILGKVALFNNNHVDGTTGVVTSRKIEPFAVFCSSYDQPEPRVIFPGSWIPYSHIALVVDAKTKSTIVWDYHVFIGIKVTLATTKATASSNSNDDEDGQKTTTTQIIQQHYIADYDSGLCQAPGKKGTVQKIIPLNEYCAVTFSKIQKLTARIRVVSGMDYWDQFRSTRAHMLPPQMLKSWLQDKSRRTAPAPNDMLMQKPHPTDAATCGDEAGVDLAHFINMAPSAKIAPGVVLSVDDFAAGKW